MQPSRPLAGKCYNLPRLREKMSRRVKLIELLACLWIIGAQTWYYAQFAELFRSVLQPILRGLWR